MNNTFSQPEDPQDYPTMPQGQPRPQSGLLNGDPEQQAQQQPQQMWRGPAFMARPAQIVKRWSNKMATFQQQGFPMQRFRHWNNRMAALRQPAPPVNPDSLVRYRAPEPPAPLGTPPTPTSQPPWRRSRATKITRMMRKRRERSTPKTRRIGVIITSVLLALIVILAGSGAISSYAYYQSQLPQLQGLANMQLEQSTRFYDRNGHLLYTLYDTHVGRSTPISYNDIPGYLQDAQVAAEDKTFWDNTGVDVTAIVRSAFIDAQANQAKTGASTLTQQVIKNLINNEPDNKKLLEQGGGPDRSPQRKISEAALAIGLTGQYPKWKIMEMYFNISSYGAQEQGVEAAAQDYFGLKPQCDANFKCLPAVTFLDRDLTKCKDKNDEATCQVDPILGLARASLLASIPQNPVIYDPTVFPKYYPDLLARQDYTLKQMKTLQRDGSNSPTRVNLGLGDQTNYAQVNAQDLVINDEVIQQAETLSKNFKFVGFQGYNQAPYFIQWVIQDIANSLGGYQDIDPNTGISVPGYRILLTGGFNIRTTLDLNLETYVESAMKRHILQPEVQKLRGYTATLIKDNNIHDSATVVMNAKTGEVLAMEGSLNHQDTSKQGASSYNMALVPRQPGSSFKPIVIATAYQMGWYPGIVLPDNKSYFPKQGSGSAAQSLPVSNSALPIYIPTDYSGSYTRGRTNIAEAIANSYNIPAVKALMYAGVPNVYTMAQRLGITSINPQKTTLDDSMALGTYEVPLLQMVGAYQTFANYGVRIPPHGVLDIWDNYGHKLYHYDTSHPNGTRVLSPQVSFLVTSTMDNETLRYPEFLNDHDLSMWDWTLPDGTHPDVATKTGTTQDYRDNLTIGYTPDVVVGVWSGNTDNSQMINSIGITGAAPIWHSVIEYVSGKCNTATDQIPCPPLDLHFTDRHFSVPGQIIQAPVNHYNGLAGYGYTSYMLDGEQPQQSGHIGGSGPTCTPHRKRHC